MLKLRIITALALLAVLLPALFAPTSAPFAMAALVLLAAAAWEWARLNGAGRTMCLVLAALVLAACQLAWLTDFAQNVPLWVWWVAGAVWLLGGSAALRVGVPGWPRVPKRLRWAVGLLMLWVTWLALAEARRIGVNFVLSLMCLVWAADIAAYAAGRAFGRRKLAPSISPGKSWEGAIGGALAVVLLAFGWLAMDGSMVMDSPSLYGALKDRLGTPGLIVAVLFLSAMSVVGDLVESLVKRAAGAKDSSRLLPGHGGVLDRVDALLPVFPLAMALHTLGR
jgi:phosphatidate cytidylyltransferase